MRWARVSLRALAVSAVLVVAWVPTAALALHGSVSSGPDPVGPPLALESQTPWVTPAAPWFSLAAEVGSTTGPVGNLHVRVSFYPRINNATQLAQSTNSLPAGGEITHVNVPVTVTPEGRGASVCATVLRTDREVPPTPPAGTPGVCPADAQTVVLDCTPDVDSCGDVYPVSVALFRQSTELSRFTTFLTYQEPQGPPAAVGPLDVGLILPLSKSGPAVPTRAARTATEGLVALLAVHRGLSTTLEISPTAALALLDGGGRQGHDTLVQLAALTGAAGGDQLLGVPYVPIDVADLEHVGLGGEIAVQLARGGAILRLAGLHPTSGSWVDTTSSFSASDTAALAAGLGEADAGHLVLDDSDLATAGLEEYTFAQPFTLALGHGSRVSAVGTTSLADSRFTADAGDPTLAANQLLATLAFIHFENVSLSDPRGMVLDPPPSWQPSPAFLDTLFAGLSTNPALSTVTLDQFFAKVPQGGNGEPATRRLQAGADTPSNGITKAEATHLAVARDDLSSFTLAVSGHPSLLTGLSDLLLGTESDALGPAQRSALLATYAQRFGGALGLITLGTQGTITFTSRTAPIPLSVLSAAPFRVTVVLSLDSNKFTFPNGNTRTLTLGRPTTPVRLEAHASTSGDRLPVEVTLTTPDGRLVIAHATLTVHATSISFVGIGLTVLAALVLLVWWVRTWRRGRRRRPRVH